MNIDVMYSSQSNEWATPAAVFEMLDREFHFTLDPACTHENAKCEKHYTAAEDGLSQDGGGRPFSAILPMVVRSPGGSRSVRPKRRSPALAWCC